LDRALIGLGDRFRFIPETRSLGDGMAAELLVVASRHQEATNVRPGSPAILRALAILAALALAHPADAQVVQGRVLDSASARPVAGLALQVRAGRPQRSVGWTKSDEYGDFRLAVSDSGPFSLWFELPDGTVVAADDVAPSDAPEREFVVPYGRALQQRIYLDSELALPVGFLHRVTPIHPGDEDSRGEVVIQIAIDSLGRPDMRTLKALSSPSDRATAAMVQALRQWRFKPAETAGRRPVRQLVVLRFVFG
jgi:TonB family protein